MWSDRHQADMLGSFEVDAFLGLGLLHTHEITLVLKVMTGAEVVAWAVASMGVTASALTAWLVCSKCGYTAGYFHLINPVAKIRH